MVKLGVGKNMVRAIRFWVVATGIAQQRKDGGYAVTELGHALLAEKGGMDPYLEDRRTLWLLHWKLSTVPEEPLFAWDFLLNRWPHPEMTRTEVVRAFAREAKRLDRKLSPVTIDQHFDVFLHTYFPTRSRKGNLQEDNLDCPLVEIDFIRCVGERQGSGDRREPIYSFNRASKPDISSELFVYFLDDYWGVQRPNEKTLTFRDVSVAHGSPGQVLKLSEIDVRSRLESLQVDSEGVFQYQESRNLQRIIRKKDCPPMGLLRNAFTAEEAYA